MTCTSMQERSISGSLLEARQNIKPELVDGCVSGIHSGVTPEPFAYEIHRRELYADLGKNGKRTLVPLGELGQDVASEQV